MKISAHTVVLERKTKLPRGKKVYSEIQDKYLVHLEVNLEIFCKFVVYTIFFTFGKFRDIEHKWVIVFGIL